MVRKAAFYEVPQWQRSPESLRDHLTRDEVDASRDALARFVGVEAYEAAGGGIRRDLFADEQKGVFLTDAGLLEKLAHDRLADAAESVRAEGWGWVEVTRVSSAELHTFSGHGSRRDPQSRGQTHRSWKRSRRGSRTSSTTGRRSER
jgi:ParB family chromosome partitioning protein